MALNSQHPEYTHFADHWQQMRDTYRGQAAVKARGLQYLPATQKMEHDGLKNATDKGYQAYSRYRMRALCPDLMSESVEAMLGVMHGKPAVIELPDRMEFLRENATYDNESLQMLLRRINEEQLITGRLGLHSDVIDRGERQGELYISVYSAESIINWDAGQLTRESDEDGNVNVIEEVEPRSLNLVVLDETGVERIKDFEWVERQKYRVLILGDPMANESDGVYRQGVFRETESFSIDAMREIALLGNRGPEQIPFVFINSKDVVPSPDMPPLLGVSDLVLAIYRLEADYRQALFMQGQDTLFLAGMTDPEKKDYVVGAGAAITAADPNAKASFIGTNSQGIPEMRESLQNDYTRARGKAAHMLETTGRQAESGDALKIRVSARTATLNQIAETGAFGLQSILRIMGKWMGLDDSTVEEIRVTPNLDFVDDEMTGQSLAQIMASKAAGAPISLQSIHALMNQRGMTEMTFEEEIDLITQETDLLPDVPGSTDPSGPEDDDENS